jgi:ArsR family transcriptional regulator, virulence genes transcriptional regulator
MIIDVKKQHSMTHPFAKRIKSHTSELEAKAEEAAAFLGAMANPVRLLILCSLVDGEKSVTDLVAKATISQSAISQHLSKMRNLELVATRRDGQTIYYRLADNDVRKILGTIYGIFCKAK